MSGGYQCEAGCAPPTPAPARCELPTADRPRALRHPNQGQVALGNGHIWLLVLVQVALIHDMLDQVRGRGDLEAHLDQFVDVGCQVAKAKPAVA